MGATLHDLVAGTSANHDTAKGAAVGQLKYYTKPFSWGYRWLATMLMPDQNALAGYGKNPARGSIRETSWREVPDTIPLTFHILYWLFSDDAGVEKMAKIMEGEKQALINFDVEVPSNFALPPSAHILHLVFCKIKDSDEARDGFNSFCYELAELTQGGLGEWPGRLIHFGPMMKQKLSRGYTHGELFSHSRA